MATALITGASAGLGLEFAWQLATARHDLVLVARDEQRLQSIARQLRAAAGVTVEVLPADLADREQTERVAERLRTTENPVSLLVNNAGYAVHEHFTTGDIHKQETSLDVLVRAVMVLSRACLDQMLPRERGAILNVSSVAALTASGTYSPTRRGSGRSPKVSPSTSRAPASPRPPCARGSSTPSSTTAPASTTPGSPRSPGSMLPTS